ncbi:MAG TPA: LPS export ABC transporter permease LptG [Nitrospirota bacterium]|nr:LPS export ABC transporter permease LptG [Nitrospirota bacterium]
MNLLNRYIFKEFIRFFLTALAVILGVYLCVTFLQKADDFIKYKATSVQVFKYFLYGLPAIATPSIPISALLATLLSLGNLSRHNEIIAMRSTGVSLGRIVAPVLVGGLIISCFGFINNELIMPVYSARANYLQKVVIEKKQEFAVFQLRRLWLRGPENSIVNIDFIAPDRSEMFGLNIYKLNPDYTLRERIKARSLSWENGAWRLKDSRKFVLSGEGAVSLPADGEIFNVVEGPKDLGMIAKGSEEMNFTELWDYVRRLKASGYNNPEYEVDLYLKLAFPLSSLLMAMISAPLSLHRVRSGGTGWSIAFAVLIAFAYWAALSTGTALGRSGALSPLIAAWTANIFFAGASAYALMRMHRES